VSSPPTPGAIARVVAHKDVVYTAYSDNNTGGGVWVFKRGKKIGEFQAPGQKWGAWKELIVFGEWLVGAFDRALVIWRRETGEVYTEIEMGGKSGAVTAVCHPSAYLNKVVVARRNGDLEIWNVKTRYLTPGGGSGGRGCELIQAQQEDLYYPRTGAEYADFVEGSNDNRAESRFFGAGDWIFDGRNPSAQYPH
jgi:hypothetical protein